MLVNTPASQLVQVLRTWLGPPSGPVTFHGFTFRMADLTFATVTVDTDAPKADAVPLTFCSK